MIIRILLVVYSISYCMHSFAGEAECKQSQNKALLDLPQSPEGNYALGMLAVQAASTDLWQAYFGEKPTIHMPSEETLKAILHTDYYQPYCHPTKYLINQIASLLAKAIVPTRTISAHIGRHLYYLNEHSKLKNPDPSESLLLLRPRIERTLMYGLLCIENGHKQKSFIQLERASDRLILNELQQFTAQ